MTEDDYAKLPGVQRARCIGGQVLLQGDCLEVMPGLGRVDAYIMDPPYEAEAHGDMRRSRLNGVATRDPLSFAPIDESVRRAVATYAAKCSGWSITFCQPEAVTLWRDVLVDAGAKYRRAMVWCKPDSAPQFNGQGPAQGYESIVAAWCGSGVSRWNGGGRRGFFIHPQVAGRFGGHKTEKPIALMKELVELFTNSGDRLVLWAGMEVWGRCLQPWEKPWRKEAAE